LRCAIVATLSPQVSAPCRNTFGWPGSPG